MSSKESTILDKAREQGKIYQYPAKDNFYLTDKESAEGWGTQNVLKVGNRKIAKSDMKE